MRNDLRAAMAMLCVGVLATLVLVTLPILVAGMLDAFDWDDRYAGWLAAADMSGSAVASLWVINRVGRIDWRRWVRSALVVVVAGNVASIWAHDLWTLATARGLAGFGNGLVLSVVFVGLCHARNAARLFGAYTFAQLVLQTLGLLAAPALIEAHGMPGIYVALALVAAGSALLVSAFPRNLAQWRIAADRANAAGTASATEPRLNPAPLPRDPGASRRVGAALAAQAIYFLAPGAVWTYLERIGQTFGLATGEVGRALALATVAGFAGAVTVILLGARLGSLRPMIAGTVTSLLAMWLLIGGTGLHAYLLAASLFNFGWNFTFPYQMSVLAQLDATGAVATASLLAQLCALAIGPLAASLLLASRGYDAVLITSCVAFVVSLLLFAASNRRAAAALPVQERG